MHNDIVKSDLGIFGIINIAFKVIGKSFKEIVLFFMLFLLVPNFLLAYFEPVDMGGDLGLYIYLFGLLLKIIFGFVGLAFVCILTKQIVFAESSLKIDFKDLVKKGFVKFPAVLKTYVPLVVLTFLLFLCFIIPGIIFSIFWTFAFYVAILSDKSGWSAMKYSKEIVDGRWWKTFGYSFVFGVILFIISISFFAPIALYTSLISEFVFVFLINVLSDIFTSFSLVVYTVFYLNFEATKSVVALSEFN